MVGTLTNVSYGLNPMPEQGGARRPNQADVFIWHDPGTASFMTGQISGRPGVKRPSHNLTSSPSPIDSPRGSLGYHRWLHNPFPPFFSVLRCPLGLGEFQASPSNSLMLSSRLFFCLPCLLPSFTVFLSALSSSPFHCALQDGFGQTWSTGDMSLSLQFASLCGGQEVFVLSDCLLELGTDLLFGNTVFVWDAWYITRSGKRTDKKKKFKWPQDTCKNNRYSR